MHPVVRHKGDLAQPPILVLTLAATSKRHNDLFPAHPQPGVGCVIGEVSASERLTQ